MGEEGPVCSVVRPGLVAAALVVAAGVGQDEGTGCAGACAVAGVPRFREAAAFIPAKT